MARNGFLCVIKTHSLAVQVVGREMLIHLVSHFLTEYNSDELITALLNSTLVHFLFTMNPDGFLVAYRHSRRRGDCLSETGRLLSHFALLLFSISTPDGLI